MASAPGTRSRPCLQWNPDQPLLGPHIGVLHQQVIDAGAGVPFVGAHLCHSSRFGSDFSQYVVRVGASEQTVTPEMLVVHRKFKGQSGGHDLALLKLPSSKGHCLTFEPSTNAACLPPADTPSEGSSCVVIVTAGWTGPGMSFTNL